MANEDIDIDIVYWKSLDELRGELRAPTRSRRDFLTLMGFSVSAAATVAATACSRAPAQQAIPFASEPEEVVPGVANWYATTCAGCSAACGLLVKTRDGRPIKVEGNSDSPIFGGGTCAAGQATVLSLYDEERLRGPRWQGQPTTWADVDRHVRDGLKNEPKSELKHEVKDGLKKNGDGSRGGRIVLLSGSVLGPATREIIAESAARDARFRHVVYEPVSFSAVRQAHRYAYGRALVPHYRFDRAAIIVGLEADFLGTWLSPVEFTRQYASRRTPGKSMAQHIQFESGVSLTGANADQRHAVPPSAIGPIAAALADRVAVKAGHRSSVTAPASPAPIAARVLDDLAARLWAHRGEALIVCGVQDVATQVLVSWLNYLLEAPIELDTPSLQAQADDEDMATLIGEMERGEVAMLMVYGVNPAYDYVDAGRFVAALARVPLVVSLSDRLDETAVHAHAVCPDHHFLEAWGDAEPIASYYSLSQPTIAPLFDTRAAQDSLRTWLGSDDDVADDKPRNFHAYLRDYWLRHIHPRQSAEPDPNRFWDHALQRGFVDQRAATPSVMPSFVADVVAPAPAATHTQLDRYELHLYQSVALRDGRQANNPWLQELPDPITKLTWGNVAAIAPALAARLGLQDGEVIDVGDVGNRVELPVCIQPGQSPETVSIALGYGRTHAGRVARGVGANGFRLRRVAAAAPAAAAATGVTIRKTGRREQLARTQTHHSMEGRPLVREVSLRDFLAASASASRDEPTEAEALPMPTLWAEHDTARHSWGMTIDLNACTGCSACIIGCQAENNVPVVGKDEVRRGREMHWIRVDRYYRGPEAAPDTAFQPVMCQHCANAPCETVCPVLATVHSSDGLNQQVYNRCIGTRYCENNCPYKVRRFNWFTYAQNERFDYVMNSPLETMVLNPDVVVRSRGVMEKCSLCVQRIQAGKLAAKHEGRPLADGDIKTACQQACPAQAITFGDLHDPASVTASLQQESRHYHLLGDLGTRPSVGYLTKIRNRDGEV